MSVYDFFGLVYCLTVHLSWPLALESNNNEGYEFVMPPICYTLAYMNFQC